MNIPRFLPPDGVATSGNSYACANAVKAIYTHSQRLQIALLLHFFFHFERFLAIELAIVSFWLNPHLIVLCARVRASC